MNKISKELQSLSPSAKIDLFAIDMGKQGGPTEHFHAGTNEVEENIIWQGVEYKRMPVQVEGFEKRAEGALPRPIMRVSNLQGVMAAYAREFGYFLGCRVIRRRTFARFLDAINFKDGNPEADPDQYLPEEIWFVDRKSKENPQMLEFELASGLDMQGVLIPARQIIENSCAWIYRSGEGCTYAGPPVALEDGTPTVDPLLDRCGKRLSDCKLRFGANAVLPYGGFPGAGRIR